MLKKKKIKPLSKFKAKTATRLLEIKGKILLEAGTAFYIKNEKGFYKKFSIIDITEIELSGMAAKNVEVREAPGDYHQTTQITIKRLGVGDADEE